MQNIQHLLVLANTTKTKAHCCIVKNNVNLINPYELSLDDMSPFT